MVRVVIVAVVGYCGIVIVVVGVTVFVTVAFVIVVGLLCCGTRVICGVVVVVVGIVRYWK